MGLTKAYEELGEVGFLKGQIYTNDGNLPETGNPLLAFERSNWSNRDNYRVVASGTDTQPKLAVESYYDGSYSRLMSFDTLNNLTILKDSELELGNKNAVIRFNNQGLTSVDDVSTIGKIGTINNSVSGTEFEGDRRGSMVYYPRTSGNTDGINPPHRFFVGDGSGHTEMLRIRGGGGQAPAVEIIGKSSGNEGLIMRSTDSNQYSPKLLMQNTTGLSEQAFFQNVDGELIAEDSAGNRTTLT